MDQIKIEVIEKIPPPSNIKGVRRFLSQPEFYRIFIKDFSKKHKDIVPTAALQHDVPYVFNKECDKSFRLLKQVLVSTPIVKTPNWTKPFELICDASAIGVVLGTRCFTPFTTLVEHSLKLR